jgi:hypothetical protein
MSKNSSREYTPNFVTPILILVVLIASVIGCYYWFKPAPVKTREIQPLTVVHNINRDSTPITIVFSDTTDDGRPMYSILLSDSTGLDSMYPEEIANSLNTGKWQYNEDLRVQ